MMQRSTLRHIGIYMVAALALSGSTALAAVTAATPAATPVAAPADAPIVLKVVDGGIPVSLTGKPGDAVTGKSVFMDRGLGNCYACHTVSLLKDQPFPGEIGPTLDGVGTLLTVPQLRMVVSNAKLMFPDTIMPAFHKNADLKDVADKFKGKPMLTSQQVEDVVAFLATLK